MRRSNGLNKGKLLLYSSVATLGGLLFGFDIAIITSAGPFLTKSSALTGFQEGWVYSSLLFGCIVGTTVVGSIADKWGRKRTLILAASIIILLSLCMVISKNLIELVFVRIIGGIAVGAFSTVVPIYISGVSPVRYRGRLVSTYHLFIVTGIFISYFIDYMLYDSGESYWQWMFTTRAIPSVVFVIMLLFVSKTQRFLYIKGRKVQEMKVLEIIGNLEDKFKLNGEFKPIEMDINSTDEKFMFKVTEIIKKEISNTDFNVENFGHLIGMSRGHLHRKLKGLVGQNPSEFIRTIRLKQAAYILQNENISVSEICYLVGFSSPSYFSSCFHKQFGLTPTEYKNKQANYVFQ